MSKVLPFTEANTRRISSLYRRALRIAFDSSLKFDAYRQETMKLRSQFQINKDVLDPNELESIVTSAKQKLIECAHPDPYIPPSRPGGTKYERNLPRPNEPLVPGDW